MTTKVFYTGPIPGTDVRTLTIYTNPPGQLGGELPVLQPFNHIDKIYYDSRFLYFSIIRTVNFTKPFIPLEVLSSVGITKKGKSGANVPIERNIITPLTYHNLGYTPATLLFDTETKQAVCGQNILQNIGNSFRAISVTADSQYVYLKEKIFVYKDKIPSLTKKYVLLVFKQTAEIPNYE